VWRAPWFLSGWDGRRGSAVTMVADGCGWLRGLRIPLTKHQTRTTSAIGTVVVTEHPHLSRSVGGRRHPRPPPEVGKKSQTW